MALHNIVGSGDAKDLRRFRGRVGATIEEVLGELQRLKVAITAGAAADADITVTGIRATDTIRSVIAIDGDNATPADSVIDVTSEVSITANDTIRLSTTSTAAYRLMVTWYDKA